MKIKDNKTGMVESDVNSNNIDNGNEKNNKTQEKTVFKNSPVESSYNTQSFKDSQNFKAEKIENHYYYETKAREDSKNEQILSVIDLKSQAFARIYEIRDVYVECNNCIKIWKNEYIAMMKKLAKQEELRKSNIAGILPKEGEKYLIGNPPAMIGTAGVLDVQLVNYQNEYLENYKAMKPPYFHPCEKHFKLSREWENLDLKIKDYETLIKK